MTSLDLHTLGDWEAEGRIEVVLTGELKNVILAGFKKRKLICVVISTNDSRLDIMFTGRGFSEAEREG